MRVCIDRYKFGPFLIVFVFTVALYTELLPLNFGYPNCDSWIFVVFGLVGLVAVVALIGITIWWQRKRSETAGETERLVVS
jgi:hypothetical protein